MLLLLPRPMLMLMLLETAAVVMVVGHFGEFRMGCETKPGR